MDRGWAVRCRSVALLRGASPRLFLVCAGAFFDSRAIPDRPLTRLLGAFTRTFSVDLAKRSSQSAWADLACIFLGSIIAARSYKVSCFAKYNIIDDMNTIIYFVILCKVNELLSIKLAFHFLKQNQMVTLQSAVSIFFLHLVAPLIS